MHFCVHDEWIRIKVSMCAASRKQQDYLKNVFMESSFQIGSWIIEPQLNKMTAPDRRVTLEPRTMKVLVYLVQKSPDVVSREELLGSVWEDSVVTEHSLTIAISDLRKLFGDDPRSPAVIETIRGVGYRLIAPVNEPSSQPFDTVPKGLPITPVMSVPQLGDGLAAGYEVSTKKRRLAFTWGIPALLVALVLVVGFLFWFDRDEIAIHNIKPLTTMAGIEVAPVFSPDSRRVAFVAFPDTGGLGDIFIHQIGAPAPVRFTEEPGAEMMPAWSPDGQFVIYLSYAETGCALFKRPSFGGAPLKLIDISCNFGGMTWAPNGKTVVLSAYDSSHSARRLFLLHMEGLRLEPLTTPSSLIVGDYLPRFSPDGFTLAFIRNLDNATQDIYLLNTLSPEIAPVRLTWDTVPIYGLDWMADGKTIVFASGREGKKGLWRVENTGAKSPRLIREVHVEDPGSIALARSGGQMIYTDWTYEVNVWRVHLSDSTKTPVIRSTRVDSHPGVSSENKLVFISSRTGYPEIWVSDAEGNDAAKLTSLEHSTVRTPAWSPDGHRIAFESRESELSDIYIIDADGGMPVPVVAEGSREKRPSWSRDGQSLYFGSDRSGQWQIWRHSLTSGDATQITEHGGLAGWESEDRSKLYYTKPDTSGIWVKLLADGNERLLIDADPSSFALVNQHIYYIDPRMHIDCFSIMRYELDTEKSKQVASIPVKPFNIFSRWGFTVSPDEQWIYYGQIDKSESDLMITEWEH